MKLYWGNYAPQEALFSCPRFFRGIPERVERLPSPQTIQTGKRIFLPEKKQWVSMVHTALAAIERGEIEKVVLSRTLLIELVDLPDPFALTAALEPKKEGATLFCLADETRAFLGASPERLFSRRERSIETDAMAGTQWSGNPFGEKEGRELEPVERFLNESLLPLCDSPPVFSPVRIHKTHHIEHLCTTCRGLLQKGVTDSAIANRLHPTPALSGWPREEAWALIQKLEPFQRGLYGSFIGWSTEEAAEYIVTIRSCFIEGKWARLTTGAGIVAGSDPEIEWEELNQKLKLYEGIFL